jgi:hypothetical protein
LVFAFHRKFGPRRQENPPRTGPEAHRFRLIRQSEAFKRLPAPGRRQTAPTSKGTMSDAEKDVAVK